MIWETYVRVYSTMGEQMMKKKKGESCQVEHERVCSGGMMRCDALRASEMND